VGSAGPGARHDRSGEPAEREQPVISERDFRLIVLIGAVGGIALTVVLALLNALVVGY
jgi:hypothetical protein